MVFGSPLLNLTSESLSLYESLPQLLGAAENDLDQAESDFSEGAFSPCWDSLESAAKHLGKFHDAACHIALNAEKHLKMLNSHTGTAPRFPITQKSVSGMVAAGSTNLRMQELSRKAQCNFQFATIYEQRKTNQLLVAGFTNLSQVIDGVGNRILSSIEQLNSRIKEFHSMVDGSLQSMNSSLDALVDIQSEALSTSRDISRNVTNMQISFDRVSAKSSERHDRALKMLDNIQRGKRPPEGTLERMFYFRRDGDTTTPHNVSADN